MIVHFQQLVIITTIIVNIIIVVVTDTAKRCLNLLARMSGDKVTRARNMSIVLGCLADKLAGPRSTDLMTRSTLDFLVTNLGPGNSPPVILFSLIALEKFAQTSENKVCEARTLYIQWNNFHQFRSQ